MAVLGLPRSLTPAAGHEQVIAALRPEGAELGSAPLVVCQTVAPWGGHEDLRDALVAQAAAAGPSMRVTGFLPDADLTGWLRSVAVPVAPNAGSAPQPPSPPGSGTARRPLVPDSAYGRELAERGARHGHALPDRQPRRLADRDRGSADRSGLDPDQRRGLARVQVRPRWRPGTRGHYAAADPRRRSASTRPVDGAGQPVGPADGLEPPEPPAVSVVVPYYQAQLQLDLVLAALSVQTHPATRLEVVVADDGSATPPDLGAAAGLATRLVRQPDQGFRAAAAATSAPRWPVATCCCSWTGTRSPSPTMCGAWPGCPPSPDALVVGRRRHADLTGWDQERLVRWLGGRTRAGGADRAGVVARRVRGQPRPAGRRRALLPLRHLRGLRPDPGPVHRARGFDPDFTGYGGEDWEMAHRAWVAGALLAHVPEAVAWHDGADWADREGPRTGGQECGDPTARRGAARPGGPRRRSVAAVSCRGGPLRTRARTPPWPPRWAFRGDTDCGIWVTGPDGGRYGRPARRPSHSQRDSAGSGAGAGAGRGGPHRTRSAGGPVPSGRAGPLRLGRSRVRPGRWTGSGLDDGRFAGPPPWTRTPPRSRLGCSAAGTCPSRGGSARWTWPTS